MTDERVVRRLAAILAADVVGYSRLMGRDENGTVTCLKAHRTERLEPTLARHGGRLVKLTGDGALVEFPSAVDAVGAAIEFQQAMAEANRNQPEDTRIVFRIGLHLGDLIVDGDDLYGDGVNVAARLEGEAAPGGIVISSNVHDAVAGRLKATFEELGRLVLKNIERPIRAFGVKWEAADWKVPNPSAATLSTPAAPTANVPLALPDKPSIAVLAFQNMSGDPEQEYFVDGLVEDIITALSRFKSLFVIARNSSFAYKGKTVDVKQIGRELGVRYVLEGSVRKAVGRVRITGQLIDSGTGAHLWADQFDGSLEDVFELQDKVTARVVSAIAPKVTQAEIERAQRKPGGSLDAYDFYLRGLAGIRTGGLESLREAQEFCYRAIERDPHFAAVHALAAFCYASSVSFGATLDIAAVAETNRLVKRAIELDESDAVVLGHSAWARANVLRDTEGSANLVGRALALNPNLALAWNVSGWVNVWLGLPDLGVEHFAQALRLNPLDTYQTYQSHVWTGTAHAHFMAGRYDEALASAEKSLREYQLPPAYRIAAASAALGGHGIEARKFLDLFLQLDSARRLSNFSDVLGPYRRPQDIERYKEGMRLAGLPE